MKSKQQLVILLHGLARSSRSFNKLEGALLKEGYSVLNIDYPSTKMPIEDLTLWVYEKISQHPNFKDATKIQFVTHSMGGIITRSILAKYDIANKGNVIMLGPPNKGSEVVDVIGGYWFFKWVNGPAGQQLSTNSELLKSLPNAKDYNLYVVAGDRTINWINSLMIDGPDDGKVSVAFTFLEGLKEHKIIHTVHPFMMKNKEVIEYVINTLQN